MEALCTVMLIMLSAVATATPLPTSDTPLLVAGDRVWWQASPGQPASLALAELRCDDMQRIRLIGEGR